MSRLERYLELIRSEPSLFTNAERGITVLTTADEIRRVEAATASRLRERGRPEALAEIGVVYEDPYIVVLRDAVVFPDGAPGTYIRILPQPFHAVGVAILARAGDRIAVLRHYRHATRTWQHELPRGFATPGERPEESATRELFEETQCRALALEPLGYVHPDSGLLAHRVALFLAEIDATAMAPETSEAIASVELVPVAEFERRIASGEVTDGFSMAAFLRARLRGLL